MAVAGAGAFGRNHLRVVRELEEACEGVALVAAVEPDAARAIEADKKYGIPVFAAIEELLKADLNHSIEKIGTKLRARMPWLESGQA